MRLFQHGFQAPSTAEALAPEARKSILPCLPAYRQQFLNQSISRGLINPTHLTLIGDGTPVRTAAQQRKRQTCDYKEKGCPSCSCRHHYSQPDCNWGWNSHRECYSFGYHLYMYVASDSYSNLPVFPLLEWAFRHDMLSFLHSFFTMKEYFPEFRIEKLLLDSTHDTYAVYDISPLYRPQSRPYQASYL